MLFRINGIYVSSGFLFPLTLRRSKRAEAAIASSVYCVGANVIVRNELSTVTDADITLLIQTFISSMALDISVKVQTKVTVDIVNVILDMINPMLLFL